MIEVEITSSAIAKMKLFAAMGVPEVWRHDGERLEMLRLTGGTYTSIASSLELPGLSAETIDSYIDKRFEMGETHLIQRFRKSLG